MFTEGVPRAVTETVAVSRVCAVVFLWLASMALVSCSGSTRSDKNLLREHRSDSADPGVGSQPANTVTVEIDSHLKQTTYSIAREDCRINWVVYSSEANRGVISHRCYCRLPLAEQAPLFAALLEKLVGNPPDHTKYHTLFGGRLYPDGKPNPEMAMRLMLAAKRSDGWDSVRGIPAGGDKNGFVRDLMNEASTYPELKAVFLKAGLDIRVSSVEKVLVLKAGELSFFNQLQGSDVKPADKLPFDCMTWFSITAAASCGEPSRLIPGGQIVCILLSQNSRGATIY